MIPVYYIKQWTMCLIFLDFKVFESTTSGQAIFKYQKDLLKLTEGGGSPVYCLQLPTRRAAWVHGVCTFKILALIMVTVKTTVCVATQLLCLRVSRCVLWLVHCVPLSCFILTQSVLLDHNIQGVNGTISSVRTLAGYFSSLTQASGQLLGAQVCSLLSVYKDCKVVHLL